MARNRIAEAFIELKARGTESVRRALKGTERDLDKTARTADKASGGVEKMGQGAERLQSTLGKLLFPVAFLSAIGGAVSMFTRLVTQSSAFRRELQEMRSEIEALSRTAAQGERGFQFADAESLKNLREAQQRYDDIAKRSEQLQEQAQGDLVGTALREILGPFAEGIDTLAEAQERLDEAARVAGNQLEAARRSAEAASARDLDNRIAVLEVQNQILQGESAIAAQIIQTEQEASRLRRSRRTEEADILDERVGLLRGLYEEERRLAKEAADDRRRSNRELILDLEQAQRESVSRITQSQSQSFSRMEDLLVRVVDRLEQVRRNTRR